MPAGWRTPFPLKLGGGGSKLVSDLYVTAKAGTGSLLLGGAGTETDLENRVLARMIAIGYRAARRRANGADPAKLHAGRRLITFPDDGSQAMISPLERMEKILRLSVPPGRTLTQRRQAVADRLLLVQLCNRAGLRQMIDALVSPWVWSMPDPDVTTGPTAFWQGATGSGGYPGSAPSGTQTWTSTLGLIAISVESPAHTPQSAKDRLSARLTTALDDMLPAYADFQLFIS